MRRGGGRGVEGYVEMEMWDTVYIYCSCPLLGLWATGHSRQTSQATSPLSASTSRGGRIESDSRACYLDFARMTSRLTNKTFEPAFRDFGELLIVSNCA